MRRFILDEFAKNQPDGIAAIVYTRHRVFSGAKAYM
jgi:hypothetical protein